MGYGAARRIGSQCFRKRIYYKKEAWKYIEQANTLCADVLHTPEEIDKSFLIGKAMKSEKIEDWDRFLSCYSRLDKYRK